MIDAPEGTFNPLAQVQFGHGAFPEFSQSLLLATAFEDEDGLPRRSLRRREYEMPNAKREVPGENARKRSWKRTAWPIARGSAQLILRKLGRVFQLILVFAYRFHFHVLKNWRVRLQRRAVPNH